MKYFFGTNFMVYSTYQHIQNKGEIHMNLSFLYIILFYRFLVNIKKVIQNKKIEILFCFI